MHAAAAEGDDGDNDGGDMELVVMVSGEMKGKERKDRATACLLAYRLGRRCLPRPTTLVGAESCLAVPSGLGGITD
jgi:hypothetical protein